MSYTVFRERRLSKKIKKKNITPQKQKDSQRIQKRSKTYYDKPSHMTWKQWVNLRGNIKIKTSTIPNAGLGAFAKINIPPGVIVGTYEGVRYDTYEELPKDSNYILYIDYGDYYMDAKDPTKSNWTRYINDARNSGHVNNVMFTSRGNVKTIKKIKKGEELFVSYGRSYWRKK